MVQHGNVGRDRNALRRVTAGFAVLTVVTAPFSYGVLLLITLPVLAALMANLYAGRARSLGALLFASVLGPLLLIAVVWFIGRADEVPVEGVAAASLAVASSAGLHRLRQQNAGRPALRKW